MSLKTTICGWNLFLAICLLITGVVIGSIGAAKYAPYAGFINNAKATTCTLQASQYTISRCTKWGTCLAVNWNVSYPSLSTPSKTATALVTDKYGLGYWDASVNRASRTVGQNTSCLINQLEPNSGYFKKPVQNYFAMLIIGWVFVLVGIIQCVLFGMQMCCGIKLNKMFDCDCDCDCCDSSTSTISSSSLYSGSSGNTGYSNTGGGYTGASTGTSNYGGSAYPDPETASDAEMTPIPATGAYTSAGVAEEHSASSSRSASDTPPRRDSGPMVDPGGAGVTTVTTHDPNWGGYAE